eukprot:scaffold6248_cov87-Cylindrotheca_fusiformis.AAC.2
MIARTKYQSLSLTGRLWVVVAIIGLLLLSSFPHDRFFQIPVWCDALVIPPPNQATIQATMADTASRSFFSTGTTCFDEFATNHETTTLSTSTNLFLSSSSSLGIDDIDWTNPGQAFGIIVLLAYIGISVAAGLKYIIKDGWRPKL